ncbi:PREDICTED: putative disease resistance protein At3g14460-like [Fragaria vesca subsp. vesca]
MEQLHGSLRIDRVGSIAKDDASEIEKAQLGKKKHLRSLGVRFQEEDGEQRKGDDEIVKALLQPHENLERLFIFHCHGTIESLYRIKSLQNLRHVNLYDWRFCEVLPPLGKLPSLEVLEIQKMDIVKKVGDEFFGIEKQDSETLSAGILFPKLKQLSSWGMFKWQEWEGITRDSSEIIIMPRLSSLEFWACSQLKALPDFLYNITALRTLTIEFCRILRREYEKGVGKEWHKISHIPNVRFKN